MDMKEHHNVLKNLKFRSFWPYGAFLQNLYDSKKNKPQKISRCLDYFYYLIFVLEPCHHKGVLFYVNDNTIFVATQLYSKKKIKSFEKLHQISIQGEWGKVSYYTRRHHLYYYTNWKSQPFNWLHDCSFPIKLRNNAYCKVDEALYSTCTYHQI